MSFLLDTNIISELRKGPRCHPDVANWFDTIEDQNDHLTAARLERWLQHIVNQYDDRILPVDQSVVEEWGRLNVPNPLPTIDALLAATAKVYHLVLATRNVNDVRRTGVSYINPFGAPA